MAVVAISVPCNQSVYLYKSNTGVSTYMVIFITDQSAGYFSNNC